jgi:hypothetical protein
MFVILEKKSEGVRSAGEQLCLPELETSDREEYLFMVSHGCIYMQGLTCPSVLTSRWIIAIEIASNKHICCISRGKGRHNLCAAGRLHGPKKQRGAWDIARQLGCLELLGLLLVLLLVRVEVITNFGDLWIRVNKENS